LSPDAASAALALAAADFVLGALAGFSGFSGLAAAASATGAAAGAVAVSTAGVLGTVIWSVCSSVLIGSRDSWHPVCDVERGHAGEMPYE
jgi:hypothetical protein